MEPISKHHLKTKEKKEEPNQEPIKANQIDQQITRILLGRHLGTVTKR
jgi:hypothetical protein